MGSARIYWKKRQADISERYYKEGLYYNPKNPYLLQSWAVMLEKQGNPTRAKKLLTVSVKANPRHVASWVALGKLNRQSGDTSTARFCYERACEADKRSYVALQAWGVLEGEVGNADRARELFKRSVKASRGQSGHALQAWATLERRQGDLAKAEELLLEVCPRGVLVLVLVLFLFI